MSEARFEIVARELRATAPPAPEALRERIRALPEPSTRRTFRPRPALALAVAIAIAVGVGAAAIGGLRSSPEQEQRAADSARRARAASLSGGSPEFKTMLRSSNQSARPSQMFAGPSFPSALSGSPLRDSAQRLSRAPSPLTPGSRLQQYDVSMSARVDDLSEGTKSAIRTTRRLGGYVAAADFATGQSNGDSRLDVRVPVQHVQQAIASFTELGTILSQRISLIDLQAGLDRLDRRRIAARQSVAELEAKQRQVGLTAAEQARLEEAKRTLTRLARSRGSLVRQGTYARVSLLLTTRKPAAKHTQPGRFDRFWGDAGDILGKEAIIVLYALVVAGPFVLLAALALLGERARRRRADSRLLEETA